MRVMVVGTSGSGKTTFAERLARAAGAPHIDLDAINWQPGWKDLNTHDVDEFRRRVAAAAAGESWVSSGNYSKVRPLLLERATHLVWLDYERPVVMARVIRRSVWRGLTRQELWAGTGNRERIQDWLSREHPMRWAWDTFQRRRDAFGQMFTDPALAALPKHRLRHPREAQALIDELAAG